APRRPVRRLLVRLDRPLLRGEEPPGHLHVPALVPARRLPDVPADAARPHRPRARARGAAVPARGLSARHPRAGWALFVLFLVNTLNFFDRLVIAAVVEPLRREWYLTDSQVGWVGTAFILLYAVVGLPLGRLADHWSRRALLFAGTLLWTSMTAASALATGFRTLFAARLAVGVGEAACAPAATSLLADLVPKETRGRATAIFMLGLPV